MYLNVNKPRYIENDFARESSTKYLSLPLFITNKYCTYTMYTYYKCIYNFSSCIN